MTDDSIYVTDYTLEEHINLGLYYFDDGEYVEYSRETNCYEDLLGKEIRVGIIYHYTLSGVVKTNYRNFFSASLKEYVNPPDGVKDARRWQAEKEYAIKYLLKPHCGGLVSGDDFSG